MEGHCNLLDGDYHDGKRANEIEMCYLCAKKKGFSIFSIQYGGACQADDRGLYDKYGASDACWGGGLGGPFANDVYKIIEETFTPEKPTITESPSTAQKPLPDGKAFLNPLIKL